MKTWTHLSVGLTVATLLLSASTPASAVCNSVSTPSERDLFAAHGCWLQYAKWSVDAHNMNHDDWGTRGWDDACNWNREFGKHWNAVYLLDKGITFEMGFAGRAFHDGPADYAEISRGRETAQWHSELRHQVVDVICDGTVPNCGRQALAAWVPRSSKIDLVQTSCGVYDVSHVGGGIYCESSISRIGLHS